MYKLVWLRRMSLEAKSPSLFASRFRRGRYRALSQRDGGSLFPEIEAHNRSPVASVWNRCPRTSTRSFLLIFQRQTCRLDTCTSKIYSRICGNTRLSNILYVHRNKTEDTWLRVVIITGALCATPTEWFFSLHSIWIASKAPIYRPVQLTHPLNRIQFRCIALPIRPRLLAVFPGVIVKQSKIRGFIN